jgi:hypothetical protein
MNHDQQLYAPPKDLGTSPSQILALQILSNPRLAGKLRGDIRCCPVCSREPHPHPSRVYSGSRASLIISQIFSRNYNSRRIQFPSRYQMILISVGEPISTQSCIYSMNSLFTSRKNHSLYGLCSLFRRQYHSRCAQIQMP